MGAETSIRCYAKSYDLASTNAPWYCASGTVFEDLGINYQYESFSLIGDFTQSFLGTIRNIRFSNASATPINENSHLYSNLQFLLPILIISCFQRVATAEVR